MTMNGDPRRKILLIDDDEDEYVLAKELLAHARSRFDLAWESRYEAGLEALVRGAFDACLIDYQLGTRTGLELIREALARGCRTPLILLTGHDERHVDLEALRAGAADYVPKQNLTPAVLERSVLYALARQDASTAQAELAVSERSRELVVEHITDYAIFLLDPSGKVASWNSGAERLKGYRADEIIGQRLHRFYTPEDLARHRPERALELAREHGHHEEEGWCVRKDGSRFWSNVVLTAIRDPTGALRGFAEVARDETERRRLTFLGEASAILTSSLDYQTTLSQVADLCVPFLADWCSVRLVEEGRLNTVAVRHTDPAKLTLVLQMNRRFPEADTSPIWRAIRTGAPELIAEIDDATIERTVPNPEQREILKSLGLRSAMFIPLIARGRTLGALTLIAAESDRRYGRDDLELALNLARRCGQAIDNARTHAALQVEREFLDGVVRQMREGVLVAEAAMGTVILANAEALRMMGAASIEELLRQNRVFRDERGQVVPLERLPLQRALHAGETVAAEELTFDEQGEPRTVSVSAAPVRARDGRTLGAVATFRDITDRKQAERRGREEAEGREMFFGILGHDLRTPLSAIVAGAQVLLRRGLPEPDAKAIARIASSAERMQKLISDLLDMTRTRIGGGLPIARRRVQLASLCRRVVDEISIAHPACEIEFESRGDPVAEVDPERIAQVVANLLSNAVDYGCSSGTRVSVREADQQVELEVHNLGEPIPEDLLPVIFDPFRRAANQPEGGRRQGLGLGLYITRQIVQDHGGRIEVESTREQGTTFRVFLPKRAG